MPSARPQPVTRPAYGLHQARVVELAAQGRDVDVGVCPAFQVDVGADLPADVQASEPVDQGDGLLDDPASGAKAVAVGDAASGDDQG